MLNNAKQRSHKLGIECTLTHEWILDRLLEGKCERTGLPFIYLSGTGKGHILNAFSPSLDRIDRKGPYSPDNVMIVCWIYNRAKGAFEEEQLMVLARTLVNREAQRIQECALSDQKSLHTSSKEVVIEEM